MKLGEISALLCDPMGASQKEIAGKCLDIANAKLAPRHCRAWALYHLGLLELEAARIDGTLENLWNGYSNKGVGRCRAGGRKRQPKENCIKNARSHFVAALSFLGPASDILTRNVMRSLALVTGPEKGSRISIQSACLLIHASIGCTARQELAQNFHGRGDMAHAISALDYKFGSINERDAQVDSLFQCLEMCAKPGWRFVATSICPTGEILSTSLSMSEAGGGFLADTVCIFPTSCNGNSELYDDIMAPLDTIVRKSQQQLRGITTASDANNKFNDASSKRGWWDERKRVDADLQQLLERVEQNYFDASIVRRVLFGHEESPFLDSNVEDSESDDDSVSMICGNLSSKFDAAFETPRKTSRSSRSARRKASSEESAVNSTEKSNKKRDIPERRSTRKSSSDSCDSRESAGRFSLAPTTKNDEDIYTFMILDENLHQFPIEGLPSLANRPVCRLPSLPFALAPFFRQASFSKLEIPSIDPANGSYIIDPESNLDATQERLLPFIEEVTTRHSWNWSGIVGQMPSSQFLELSLQQENGLFLFCGHGGGQKYFSRSQVERLADSIEDDSQKNCGCQSSVILMGCSSGKLESINRKGSDSISQETLFYEPEGIALSYLIAGAPCVVANLWDVTDRDIDRYVLAS